MATRTDTESSVDPNPIVEGNELCVDCGGENPVGDDMSSANSSLSSSFLLSTGATHSVRNRYNANAADNLCSVPMVEFHLGERGGILP